MRAPDNKFSILSPNNHTVDINFIRGMLIRSFDAKQLGVITKLLQNGRQYAAITTALGIGSENNGLKQTSNQRRTLKTKIELHPKGIQ